MPWIRIWARVPDMINPSVGDFEHYLWIDELDENDKAMLEENYKDYLPGWTRDPLALCESGYEILNALPKKVRENLTEMYQTRIACMQDLLQVLLNTPESD